MSIELNKIINAREIRELLVYVFSPYVKGRAAATIQPFLIGESNTRVPFAHGMKTVKPPSFKKAPRVDYNFIGSLRKEQISIIKECFSFLSSTNTLLLSTHVAFGKTVLAIYIASQLKLPVFIVVNRSVLLSQWEESIRKFIKAARVRILSANEAADFSAFDIFIINVANIPKINQTLFSVGVVIVDEVHLILSEGYGKNLLYFTPKYLIGLSATPYRSDGSNKLFDLFFGNSIVFKPLCRPHVVYKVISSFNPEIKKNASDRMDWGNILAQQGSDTARNELIVKLVEWRKELTFLILCKRVVQITALEALFKRAGISVEAVHGDKQVSGELRRVLIGTVQKLGVGFDDKQVNALIIAADVQEYFIQYLGRVFRNPNVVPVIFDIVDIRNRVLLKHYKQREKVYLQAGSESIKIIDGDAL
jgi:superfamily II DNA or RNA helicase